MKKILLLSCILFTLSSFAQLPYSTVKFNQPQYFSGANTLSASFIYQSPVSELVFPAVTAGSNDSVFTGFFSPFDTSQTVGACIEEYGKSWFGSSAVRRADMVEVYTNINGDSIYYDPQAGAGKSFRMYDYAGGDYLVATVDSIVYKSFPGYSDSVKYISMQRFDSFGNPMPDLLNAEHLEVGRDSGWVSFFEANYFPQSWFPKHRMAWRPVPNRSDVFQFNVGDVFQYRFQQTSAFGGSNYPPMFQEWTVLGMQSFNGGDSMEYYYSVKSMSFVFVSTPFPHLDTTTTQYMDTVGYGNLLSPLWTVAPMESFLRTSPTTEIAYTHLDTGYCSDQFIPTLITGTFLYDQTLDCFPTPFEPIIVKRSYAAGKGEVYYSEDARSIGGTLLEKTLIWSSVNGVGCGQHTTFTGVQETGPSLFSMYPNPAADQLFLIPSVQSNVNRISISSVAGGRIDLPVIQENGRIRVDLSTLPAGIYLVQLESQGSSSSKRFVKY